VTSSRGRLYAAIARLSAHLPPFRGRTRVFLALYRALRLEQQHVIVRASLKQPVPYEATLDLHAWAQRVAYLTGGYEAKTTRFLMELRKGEGYLLDVGANVGLIAIPFARATGARVFAVEAVPDNAAVLRANVEANQLAGQITVLELGLGDEGKLVDIQIEGDLRAGEGTGTANILPDGSQYECVRQTLRIERLDDLELPRGCSVIKIDTDGYDLKVLQGGRAFLERERPAILGEFSAHCLAWHGQTLDDVIAFAKELRYDVLATSHRAAFVEDLLLIPVETRERFTLPPGFSSLT
jgi:FkbM family methyltransferase